MLYLGWYHVVRWAIICFLVWSEIIHICPPVGPEIQTWGLHVTEQLRVRVSRCVEGDIRRRLNNGLSLWVKRDLEVLTVTKPQLTTEDDHGTVHTVPHKCRARSWTQHESAIHAYVNSCLIAMVVNVEARIVTLFNLKCLTCNWTWSFVYKLKALVHESVLTQVLFLSLIPAVDFLLWFCLAFGIAFFFFWNDNYITAIVLWFETRTPHFNY